MSFSLRCLPTLLLALIILPVSMFAQSTSQTSKVPRGVISGRITIKERGAAGIIVGARKVNRNNPFNNDPFSKTVTYQDGHYRIANLAAGTYEVIPSAPAYVVGPLNGASTKSLIVGDDETIENINFSLVRGGVIT